MENIVYNNYLYFINNILPNYFLLYTSYGTIVVDTNETNFKHLIIGTHCNNLSIQNKRPSDFYDEIEKYNIFSFINKEDFSHNNLNYIDEYILNKNKYFIEIFQSLLNTKDLIIYKKQANAELDTDYLYFGIKDNIGMYLGIIGDDKSNYHYFNTICCFAENIKRLSVGKRIKITKIEIIDKNDFIENNYTFYLSKRNPSNIIHNKPQIKKELNNSDRKIINQQLRNNLKIDKGEFGKKSIKIIKDGKILEKGMKLDLKKYDTNKKIAEYINNTY